MDSHTSYEIMNLRKVVLDARRHPADKVEALCDMYDLYTPFINERFYYNQREQIINEIRDIVRNYM